MAGSSRGPARRHLRNSHLDRAEDRQDRKLDGEDHGKVVKLRRAQQAAEDHVEGEISRIGEVGGQKDRDSRACHEGGKRADHRKRTGARVARG
jgi:hypothetical protein